MFRRIVAAFGFVIGRQRALKHQWLTDESDRRVIDATFADGSLHDYRDYDTWHA